MKPSSRQEIIQANDLVISSGDISRKGKPDVVTMVMETHAMPLPIGVVMKDWADVRQVIAHLEKCAKFTFGEMPVEIRKPPEDSEGRPNGLGGFNFPSGKGYHYLPASGMFIEGGSPDPDMQVPEVLSLRLQCPSLPVPVVFRFQDKKQCNEFIREFQLYTDHIFGSDE